ncbi:MAG: hypothetical protein ACLPWD_09895 [Methanobacterium sp.]
MSVTDIVLLQNYAQILTLSISFLGIVLAIFFTLIALPLQNILGKYSQDLVNRVNRDKYLIFCFLFFIILFAYDFSLLIMPKSTILISISFIGGLTSLMIFSLLVTRVFYLLDVRNQIKDISKKIIEEIRGKRIKIRIFQADPNLIDKLKHETEIIFDIIQKAIHEDRFEIADFGFKKVVEIVKNFICVKSDNLAREYEDDFLDHIFDRIIDTENFVSKNNHPKIMNSIVDSIGNVTKEILSTETTDPYIINQRGPLSSLTIALIESLKNICIGPEITKRTSYASGNACDQLIEIGKVSIDNKYPYKAVDVVKELSEISLKTTEMNFYRGNRLSQSSNQGIVYLLDYSLLNLDKIEMDEEYILTSIKDEVNKIIKDYFENKNISLVSNPENIKPFIHPMASYSIGVIHLKAIKQIIEDNEDSKIIAKFMDKFIDDIGQLIKLGLEEERIFDVKDFSDSIYMIGFNLITSFYESRNDLLKEKLYDTLKKSYIPISKSLELNNHINPFIDYLDNYSSLLGLMFYKNRESNIFGELIENGIKLIMTSERVIDFNEMHPYLRLIGLWVFKWMPDSGYLNFLKKILKNKNVIVSDNKSMIKSQVDVRKELYQKLYPKSFKGYWNLKTPYENENALIKPFNNIEKELIEINEVIFNPEDIIKFEDFLNKNN